MASLILHNANLFSFGRIFAYSLYETSSKSEGFMISSTSPTANKSMKKASVWLLPTSLIGSFVVMLLISILFVTLTTKPERVSLIESTEDQPLGVIVDDKLTVIDIEANSAAEQAGIKPGDKLTKVGDIVLTSPKQARDVLIEKVAEPVLEAAKKGNQALDDVKAGPIPVVVVRNGVEIVITVTPKSRNPENTGATPTPVPQNQLYF